MESEPEAKIIEACLAGDGRSYAALVRQHGRRVYAICLAMTGNAADAEDMTRDTFMRGFSELGTLRNHDRFGAWMAAIAGNVCRNFIKRRKNRKLDLATSIDCLGADPDDQSDLRDALRRLPEQSHCPSCTVAEACRVCYLVTTMIDYHLHGNFSGHGTGDLAEYVEAAVAKGFTEIGFSDHLPKVVDPDPYHAMLEENLPRYVERVLALQKNYRDRITIKLGIEADYFEGYESETRRLIDSFPFDYVLGALHFLGDWHFTSKQGLPRYESEDPAEAFPKYFVLLERMIETGLFDIVAHADALRRAAFRPVRSMEREHRQIARLLKAKGMAIEVNTAGVRRGLGSVYPERGFLAACVAERVPVTLGSDAHSPGDVGRDYAAAFRLLGDIGVTEVALYDRRRVVRKPLGAWLDKA